MRYLARSVWQLRHLSRVLGAEISSKGLERGWIAPVWISSVSRSLNGSFHNREITGYMNQAVVFVRTLSTSAANDATAGFFIFFNFNGAFVILMVIFGLLLNNLLYLILSQLLQMRQEPVR